MTERKKLTRTSRLHYLVRAAALEELTLRGLITDDDGKPKVVSREVTGDPVRDGVLALIRDSGRRGWKHWISKQAGKSRNAQRDRLVAERIIRIERRRVLGLIPVERVIVRDGRAAKELQASAARALTGATPATRLDQREVALAALAAIVELDTVCKGSVRRENRQRIKELVALSGPAVPALKKVLSEEAGAAAAA